VARRIDDDELIEHWTLVGDELGQVAGKRGATRLGFSLLLKFYTRHGQFPRRTELPDAAVVYVARQVGVDAAEIAFYDWDGRTVEYHRAQVRKFLGFRKCSVADADKLAAWLAEEVCQAERRVERVREELLKHCRDEGIEQPIADRIGRIIGSGLRQAEKALVAKVAGRIPPEVAARMTVLVADARGDEDDQVGLSLAEIARQINPVVRGWMQYYGAFYRSELYPLLSRINAYLMRWIRKKYKRLRTLTRAAGCWQRITS
jgi:hypothetical protein